MSCFDWNALHFLFCPFYSKKEIKWFYVFKKKKKKGERKRKENEKPENELKIFEVEKTEINLKKNICKKKNIRKKKKKRTIIYVS